MDERKKMFQREGVKSTLSSGYDWSSEIKVGNGQQIDESDKTRLKWIVMTPG